MAQTRTLVLLASLAFLCLAEAASASFPGRNGRIAFTVETTDDEGEIADNLLYLINRDGSDRQRIVGNAGEPAFSPSGRQIVYARQFGYNDGLRLRRADGRGGVSKLTHGEDFSPDWSPGGRRIVFSRGFYYLNRKLRIYDRGKTRPLTRGAYPAWSVKGRIAFERDGGVYVIRPDGGGLRRVVDGFSPDWSPDGGKIVFSDAAGFISTVRADGSRLRRLRRGSKPESSPDGHQIVYISPRYQLKTMGSGGKRPRRVPHSFGRNKSPLDADWQPLPPFP
jgi:Tol biopolymer transport system component